MKGDEGLYGGVADGRVWVREEREEVPAEAGEGEVAEGGDGFGAGLGGRILKAL